jgi:TctA family transporter
MQRFTLGYYELADGLNFVAVAVGIFGIGEILRNLESETDRDVMVKRVTGLMPTKADLRRIVLPVIRGTSLGSFLGVLPGGGAILAAFAAYTVEKRVARAPETFGRGAIEGVAAPEAANNAGAQTSFIPMLTLGIPANPVMALMIGALVIQGIVPGPNVIARNPDLFWGIVASMWIGNLMLVLLNLPLIGLWVKLLAIPYRVLVPTILALAAIGVYSLKSNPFDLYTLAVFGGLGYLLVRLGCEPAPLLLGFVLGPMLEEHLRRALIISRGDPMVFFERPISAALLVAAAIVLAVVFMPQIARKRAEVFSEEEG